MTSASTAADPIPGLRDLFGVIFAPTDKVLSRPIETWTEKQRRGGSEVEVKKTETKWKQVFHRQAKQFCEQDRQRILLNTYANLRAHAFFGVCPRPNFVVQFGQTIDLAWQVRIVRALWADLDHCSIEEALARCEAAGLPRPTALVSSGSGAHLYWVLAEPFEITDAGDVRLAFWRKVEVKNGKGRLRYYCKDKDGKEEDCPSLSPMALHVQDMLGGIAAKIGGDHTKDLARLLRMPGTFNRKDERNGQEPKPCVLVECDSSRRYPFADFEPFASASPDKARREGAAKVKLKTGMKLRAKQEPKLAGLLADCESAEDRSRADWHLCCWAIEKGISKTEIHSRCSDVGKFRERGESYFERTWEGSEEKTRFKIYDRLMSAPSANGNGQHHPEQEQTTEPNEPKHDPEREQLGDDLFDPHLTDTGNAMRLVALHGDNLRYCFPWGKWLCWDGRRWRIDDSGIPVTRAKDVIADLYKLAKDQIDCLKAELKDDKENEFKKARLAWIAKILSWALKSEMAARLNAMVELARSERGIPVIHDNLDTNPFLLNVLNGTLNLKTGKLQAHDPRDMITKVAPVQYIEDARCPLWEQYLLAIFEGDRGLIEWLQRIAGRCLTGDVSEQILVILWGLGANGKSVLVNVLLELLGTDYAGKAAPELLMQRHGDRHPTERADLFGKRLVVLSETDQGGKLNQTLIKELTGGEPLKARRMGEDFWQFAPTFKLFLLTNNKPVVPDGGDPAFWRRLRLVPFSVRYYDPAEIDATMEIPEDRIADKQLLDKLRGEYPGILAWLVRGCRDWLTKGLTLPEKVKAATAAYRADQDLLGQWVADCCVRGGTEYRARASALLESFNKWVEAAGGETLGTRQFSDQLLKMGFEKINSNGIWYVGIGLRQD